MKKTKIAILLVFMVFGGSACSQDPASLPFPSELPPTPLWAPSATPGGVVAPTLTAPATPEPEILAQIDTSTLPTPIYHPGNYETVDGCLAESLTVLWRALFINGKEVGAPPSRGNPPADDESAGAPVTTMIGITTGRTRDFEISIDSGETITLHALELLYFPYWVVIDRATGKEAPLNDPGTDNFFSHLLEGGRDLEPRSYVTTLWVVVSYEFSGLEFGQIYSHGMEASILREHLSVPGHLLSYRVKSPLLTSEGMQWGACEGGVHAQEIICQIGRALWNSDNEKSFYETGFVEDSNDWVLFGGELMTMSRDTITPDPIPLPEEVVECLANRGAGPP